jgi:hypothetical protein
VSVQVSRVFQLGSSFDLASGWLDAGAFRRHRATGALEASPWFGHAPPRHWVFF